MPSQPSGPALGAFGTQAVTVAFVHAATVVVHAPMPHVMLPSSSISPSQSSSKPLHDSAEV